VDESLHRTQPDAPRAASLAEPLCRRLHPPRSRWGPAVAANSLCQGQEKRSMREIED